MLNHVALVGRLTREPEYFAGKEEGKGVATFSLAFTQGKEDTGFIDCKAFNNTASLVKEWLVKGDKIALTGLLYQRKFERKDGTKSSVIEIHVDNIEFIDVLKQSEVPEVNEEELPFDKAPEVKVEEKPVAKSTRRSR